MLTRRQGGLGSTQNYMRILSGDVPGNTSPLAAETGGTGGRSEDDGQSGRTMLATPQGTDKKLLGRHSNRVWSHACNEKPDRPATWLPAGVAPERNGRPRRGRPNARARGARSVVAEG